IREYHYPGIWESLPFDLGQIPGDLYGVHNQSSSNQICFLDERLSFLIRTTQPPIEKHLEPPLIPSNYRYAGAAVRLNFQGRAGRRREGLLKDCHFRVWDGFGAGCDVCNEGMEMH